MGFKKFWLAILIVLSLAIPSYAATISSGGGHQIHDNVSGLQTQRPKLTFKGTIACTDNSGNNSTDCEGGPASPAANYYVAGHMSPAELINSNTPLWGTGANAKLGAAALGFDGSDDYATIRNIADVDPTTAWTIEAWAKPVYGELLLHMDDTGLTNSGSGSHTMTLNGNVTRSATQNKFGGYSAYFDGTSDSITTPDSSDFDFSGGNWTVDAWVYPTSIASQRFIFSQYTDTNNWIYAYIYSTTGAVQFEMKTGGTSLAFVSTNTISVNTWYHIRYVENGDNYYIFVNGVLWASTTSTIRPGNYTGSFYIGGYSASATSMLGYIDEFRTLKGIAATSAFTPPTGAYPFAYGNYIVIGKYDNVASKGGYSLEIDTSQHIVGKHWSGTSSGTCTGTTAITSAWHHLMVTYDTTANELKCYLDGAQEGSTTTDTGADYSTTVPLIIGANGSNPNTNFFNGYIDEVAVWGVALSGSTTPTIAQRYNAGTGIELAGTETNLEAVWHMNDGAGILALQSTAQTGVGSDSYDCLSATYTSGINGPCRTIQHVVDLIPKFYAGSTTFNIASGIYPEAVIIDGFNPSGNYAITIKGYINHTPNSFTDCQIIPTTACGNSFTSSGSNTTDHPADAGSLFKDTTNSPFGTSGTQDRRFLKLTGGTAGVGGTGTLTDWYIIKTNSSSSVLQIVGNWLPSPYTSWSDALTFTPNATTTYQIYSFDDMPIIHGALVYSYGVTIKDSVGIRMSKIRASKALHGGFVLQDSVFSADFDIGDLWAIVGDYNDDGDRSSSNGHYSLGMYANHSSIVRINAADFSYNRDSGFVIGHASSVGALIDSLMAGNVKDAGYVCAYQSDCTVVRGSWATSNGFTGFDIEVGSELAVFQSNRSSSNTGDGVTSTGNSFVGLNSPNYMVSNTKAGLSIYGGKIGTQSQVNTAYLNSNGEYGFVGKVGAGPNPLSDEFSYTGNTLGPYDTNSTYTPSIGVGLFGNSNLSPLRDKFFIYDDFASGNLTDGNIGSLGWTLASGGTPVVSSPAITRPGVIRLTTGATATNYTRICLKSCTSASGQFDYSDNYDITAIISVVTGTESGTTYDFGITGFSGTYYRFNKPASGTNWWAQTWDGTNQNLVDSGVAATAGTFYKLRMVKDYSGYVRFYIGNVLVYTATTYLVTGAVTPYIRVTTGTTAARSLDIDYFEMTTYITR